MILTGRLMTAVMGALTVWAIWAVGRRLFGDRTGTTAGFLYAIAPAAVVHAHYATVDVPATLFVTLALIYAARTLELATWRNVALAGLFSRSCGRDEVQLRPGSCLRPFSALLLSKRRIEPQRQRDTEAAQRGLGGADHTSRITHHALLLGTSIAGFLIGCPGVIVNPSGFSKDFSFELAKSREGMGCCSWRLETGGSIT
jgi:hypothetical protein